MNQDDKKPPNAFILFSRLIYPDVVRDGFHGNFKAWEIARRWRNIDKLTRLHFEILADRISWEWQQRRNENN
jgi:hypothetical protein